MKISVIIPVYNAAAFVTEAVNSALQQEETAEVILIDDGSTDNSADICMALAKQYPKIIFLQHADKKNHGAGSTRNLGIKYASSEWIAFLDADDVYLPERFRKTKEIIQKNADADGVYGCLGIQFESDEAEQQWKQRFAHTITHMYNVVAPENLAKEMSPIGEQGWFSIDTLTVKRSAVERIGYFSTLPLSQDTEFLLKLAITSRLYPSDNDTPCAIRRVHANNRITSGKEYFYKNRIALWKNMMEWSKNSKVDKLWYRIFRRQYVKAVLIYLRFIKGPVAKMRFVWAALRFNRS